MGRDILLVNNELLILDLLSGSGYRVDRISYAMAALRKLDDQKYDAYPPGYADAGVGRESFVRENQRAISGLGSPDHLRDGGGLADPTSPRVSVSHRIGRQLSSL